jgi:hypothetical protein
LTLLLNRTWPITTCLGTAVLECDGGNDVIAFSIATERVEVSLMANFESSTPNYYKCSNVSYCLSSTVFLLSVVL